MKMPRKIILVVISLVLLVASTAFTFSSVRPVFAVDAAHSESHAQSASLAPNIQGDLAAHDPSLIKQGSTYYVFSTGGGLQIRTSTDLVTWKRAGSVFSTIPAWVTTAVGHITDLWAPDIHYVNGTYYLYYAGSTFGSNTSVIGLATNTTLNPADAAYKWVDKGLVIQSTSANNYNAIDPNLTIDASNQAWLSFGSFWTGIKMRRLDSTTFKLSSSNTTTYALAQRAAPDAMEASYIIYRGGYYYLFVSVDYCCQGSSSTYKIAVGRSSSITGPYVSQSGVRMDQGGYTILLQTTGNVHGPGGQSIYLDNGRYLVIHHYYDASAHGAVKIQIRAITWSSDGWIQLSAPVS
jgi:arabinan endo-1,5-alpha-L-arabinosidase